MPGPWDYLKYASVALLCAAGCISAQAQDYGQTTGQEMTPSAEDLQRFEAERRRQEQLRLEAERRKQEAMRFETERLRQENERREQERLRLENERLRQEIERYEQEKLRFEREAEDREQAESSSLNAGPDVFEQLRTIGQLRDDGILTDEEFERLKKKILE